MTFLQKETVGSDYTQSPFSFFRFPLLFFWKTVHTVYDIFVCPYIILSLIFEDGLKISIIHSETSLKTYGGEIQIRIYRI